MGFPVITHMMMNGTIGGRRRRSGHTPDDPVVSKKEPEKQPIVPIAVWIIALTGLGVCLFGFVGTLIMLLW